MGERDWPPRLHRRTHRLLIEKRPCVSLLRNATCSRSLFFASSSASAALIIAFVTSASLSAIPIFVLCDCVEANLDVPHVAEADGADDPPETVTPMEP